MQVNDVLGENGLFANKIEDFKVRHAQLSMANHVYEAVNDTKQLVVEAATGVGKTYAYLVPAILLNGKTIISTGSRHLQDQLFLNDLPTVKKIIGSSAKVALLKGRANYLCQHRLSELEGRLGQLHGSIHQEFSVVKQWSLHTQSGDIAEVSNLHEGADIWQHVTSNADKCSSATCTAKTCHVVRARRDAQEADIIVVNHHLFFADLALKDEGFAELLPSANTFILDEAHQLPEIASRFFGNSLSSRQLFDLAKETVAVASIDAPDVAALKDLARQLETDVRQFRLGLPSYDMRKPWLEVLDKDSSKLKFEALIETLHHLTECLSNNAERSESLEALYKRIYSLHSLAATFTANDTETIKWYETRSTGFMLHETPLEIGSIFREHLQKYCASWIFTSATLSINNKFDHYISQMGLDEPNQALLESPFDFKQHTRLYVPKHLPLPNDQSHTEKLMDEIMPMVDALNGKTLLLFTSFKALHKAADYLFDHRVYSSKYTALVQGEAPRTDLLDSFKHATKPSILLATSGFWEGVDIRGSALQLVVIDKLPFVSPDDPVLQARFKSIEQQGLNPFSYFQIPKAVIGLKQGAGRLIRSDTDLGLLVIGDQRLKTKFYGKVFLNSLPAMPEVTSQEQSLAFLNEHVNTAELDKG